MQASVDGFYSDSNFSKVTLAFPSVAVRREAQEKICHHKEGKKWRGSLLKLEELDVQIKIAQPPFQRRRNRKLHTGRAILMQKAGTGIFSDFPIDYDLRIIKDKLGQIVAKQEQTGVWNVQFVVA